MSKPKPKPKLGEVTYQQILKTISGETQALDYEYAVPFECIRFKNPYLRQIEEELMYLCGRTTRIFVFLDGFALGRDIEYDRSRCTCSPFSKYYTCECVNVDWLIFNARKTLSNVILAYAIYTNELCSFTSPTHIIDFIGPGESRKFVLSELGFVNDENIPDDIRNAFKHPITKEAVDICEKTSHDRSLQNLDIDDPEFPYPEFQSDSDSRDEKSEPAAAAASKPGGYSTPSPSRTGTAIAPSTDADVVLSRTPSASSVSTLPRPVAADLSCTPLASTASLPPRPVAVDLPRTPSASSVSTLPRHVATDVPRNPVSSPSTTAAVSTMTLYDWALSLKKQADSESRRVPQLPASAARPKPSRPPPKSEPSFFFPAERSG